MKFSVLISVYKNDNPVFFREALESISTSQTVKPAQIVIVIDGPVPEEIHNIINDSIQKENEIDFTVVPLEINKGLATALNVGIDHCKYEWVARMDSDDISLPDRFMKQVEYIEQNPETDIVGGAISEFQNKPGDIHSERHVGLDQQAIEKMAKSRTPMNHVSVMYKKQAVVNAGKYAEDFGKLEDYKLWVDMIVNGAHMSNIDDVLVYVRTGNGFIARRSNKREITDWDMLQSYLLKGGIINKHIALKNKLYIRCFIYMPGWMKEIAYKTVLRR